MEFNSSVLSYLASVSVRSLGLAVLALAAVLVCRIKSAAALHAISTAIVAGMLALAALAPVLPPATPADPASGRRAGPRHPHSPDD
jgi:hypothetical protein